MATSKIQRTEQPPHLSGLRATALFHLLCGCCWESACIRCRTVRASFKVRLSQDPGAILCRESAGTGTKRVSHGIASTKERGQDGLHTFSLIQRSESMENNLMRYLGKYFPTDDLKRVTEAYHLGSTSKGEIIYTQLDVQGRCRTGKIIDYDKDGHRDNPNGAIRWTGFTTAT